LLEGWNKEPSSKTQVTVRGSDACKHLLALWVLKSCGFKEMSVCHVNLRVKQNKSIHNTNK